MKTAEYIGKIFGFLLLVIVATFLFFSFSMNNQIMINISVFTYWIFASLSFIVCIIHMIIGITVYLLSDKIDKWKKEYDELYDSYKDVKFGSLKVLSSMTFIVFSVSVLVINSYIFLPVVYFMSVTINHVIMLLVKAELTKIRKRINGQA